MSVPDDDILGPGSITWERFGDARGLLLIVRAGLLQAMHPAVSAALVQKSDFFSNPWNRLLRSIPPILGVIYDEDWRATGAKVRDYHRDIKGTDAHGAPYHALHPETYYWTHAVFFESMISGGDWFGEPLTEAERERAYEESIAWYARYGVSMRPVPETWKAFQEYWDHMVNEVLEPTEAALRYLNDPTPWPAPYPWLSGPAWRVLHPVVRHGPNWVARGTLPPRARELLGLTWSERDERLLRALGAAVRTGWRFVPRPLRYMPRARAGILRAERELRRRAREAQAVAA
jgi:uncharacterized protein (DUF2236 family)